MALWQSAWVGMASIIDFNVLDLPECNICTKSGIQQPKFRPEVSSGSTSRRSEWVGSPCDEITTAGRLVTVSVSSELRDQAKARGLACIETGSAPDCHWSCRTSWQHFNTPMLPPGAIYMHYSLETQTVWILSPPRDPHISIVWHLSAILYVGKVKIPSSSGYPGWYLSNKLPDLSQARVGVGWGIDGKGLIAWDPLTCESQVVLKIPAPRLAEHSLRSAGMRRQICLEQTNFVQLSK